MNNVIKKMNYIQKKAVDAAVSNIKRKNKALIHMATGTGKTETAVKIVEKLKSGKTLWLTHTDELVDQVAERFISNGYLDVSAFNRAGKNLDSKLVVASVQTISRFNHLKHIPIDMFDLIIVDECHHAAAETWERVLNHFTCPRLGLSATPYRPDYKHDTIFQLFGEPCYEYSFSDAIKDKVLAKPENVIVLTDSAIDGFKSLQKEYSEKQLEKLFTSQERNLIIVQEYKDIRKQVKRPKTVCFCINIKHAIRMTKRFKLAGIKSNFICGDSKFQKDAERVSVMNKFRTTNEIEILCAVNIFNEGVDVPEANIGLMTRPTGSNIIYQQQLGRLARSNKGKKKIFYTIDFVDNTRHEFSGYTTTNMVTKGSINTKVITKYLINQDPIAVKKTHNDVMKQVQKFEKTMRDDYYKQMEDKIDEQKSLNKFSSKLKTKAMAIKAGLKYVK